MHKNLPPPPQQYHDSLIHERNGLWGKSEEVYAARTDDFDCGPCFLKLIPTTEW